MHTYTISTLSHIQSVMEIYRDEYQGQYPEVQVVYDTNTMKYIVYPTFEDYKNDTNRISI